MKKPSREQVGALVQALRRGPLRPGDPRYVSLYAPALDPVERSLRRILEGGLGGSSLTLLVGSRGVGKTTALMGLGGRSARVRSVFGSLGPGPRRAPSEACEQLLAFAIRQVIGQLAQVDGPGPSSFMTETQQRALSATMWRCGVWPPSTLLGHDEPKPTEPNISHDGLSELLAAACEALCRQSGVEQVILALDGMDRMPGDALVAVIKEAAPSLLVPHLHWVIATAPSMFVYSSDVALMWPPCRIETMVNLNTQPTPSEWDQHQALQLLLERSGDWDGLLTQEVRDWVVKLSGGNPLELLLFGARFAEGFVRADDSKERILEQRLQADERLGPSGLAREALRLLERLSNTGSVEELTPEDLPVFSRLLDTNHILPHRYQGELRFDVHPRHQGGHRG